jgi:hypothetical protein
LAEKPNAILIMTDNQGQFSHGQESIEDGNTLRQYGSPESKQYGWRATEPGKETNAYGTRYRITDDGSAEGPEAVRGEKRHWLGLLTANKACC